jgi:hypothetical protein
MGNSPTKINPITSIDQIKKIILSSQDNFAFSYHHSIDEIIEIIDKLGSDDLFFESPFHKALEEFPPKGMYFRYIVLWMDDVPAAFLYFQLKKINLRESLDGSFQGNGNKLTIYIKKFFTGLLNFHTLVNGNMLQTGRYGLYLPPEIELLLKFEHYQSILDYVVTELKNEKLRPAAILLKDFYLYEKISDEDCSKYGYSEFSVQPNMRLDIAENWNDTEDYMSDLKSKYKVRTRRTLKKLDGVYRRELDLVDLEKYSDTMHILYKSIANQASFNLFILDPLYFYGLKKHLEDKIKIVGYFLEEKMVGFYTIVYNYDTLDAHFLGYDSDHNREFHLYHNMLYDLLFEAIDKKKKHLDLSRTAMEIKSSIGAEPSKMFLYLKVTNPIVNKFTARFLKFLTPSTDWEERNPFK